MSAPTGSDPSGSTKEDESNPSDPSNSKVLVLIPKMLEAEPCNLQNLPEMSYGNVAMSSLTRSSSNDSLLGNGLKPKNSTSTAKDGQVNMVWKLGGGSGDDPYGTPKGPAPMMIDPELSLASVGGLDNHIKYLKRAIVYPMRHQNALKEWGLDPPKGIMFHGPPGTGKTLLAKSLASELTQSMGEISFYYQKGGEVFTKYCGESEEKLRAVFEAAKRTKPSIIFFDEIDGLCPNRDTAARCCQAYAAVVATFLGQIDSCKRGEVFVIGATNRLDAVDPAIRRPGRFDKDLPFSLPDEEGRKNIIGIHTECWTRDNPDDALVDNIAKNTVGYTGADIEKLCGDAVRAAMSRCSDVDLDDVHVTQQDWANAIQNMHHSITNVFGSTLFIAKQPIPVIQPLISSIITEIQNNLEPLLPKERVGENVLQSLSRNSFLVMEDDTSSEQLMNFVMNGLLSHPKMNQITTYVLSDEVLLLQAGKMGFTSFTETVKRTIQQAIDSSKPCVLYVPRIDALDAEMESYQLASTFHNQLNSIRGQNILLLATSLRPFADMSSEIKDLFLGDCRSYKLRYPVSQERRQFFNQIFEQLIDIKDASPPKKQKKGSKNKESKVNYSDVFEAHLADAVNLTSGEEIEHVLRLYETLKRSLNQCCDCDTGDLDKARANEEFVEILDRYNDNQLL